MFKDYYLILGIERHSSESQIKHAFRTIAKQLHPDIPRVCQDTERFLDVQEAYETLVDAEKRRRHDAELNQRSQTGPILRYPDQAVYGSPPPTVGSPAGRRADVGERFIRSASGRPRRHCLERDVALEVLLSPRESIQGGLFPIELPLTEPCPHCARKGFFDLLFCPVCSGEGRRTLMHECLLSIPPRTSHGTTVSLDLAAIGLPGVRLHVRVAVDPLLEE
ncbi:MAG: DnaJ domain-containing protein [Desulfobacterales bacterium]|jgi:DnaJ-class molecular chaperone|nr:DnaJ domain-containing protein [Desulfobacterales bacterium]